MSEKLANRLQRSCGGVDQAQRKIDQMRAENQGITNTEIFHSLVATRKGHLDKHATHKRRQK
jgi:hypothetical protein